MKDITILVVDDEPDLGEIVGFEFELVGANVLTAANAREAFDVISKRNVDVIVSDIRMPSGDGVELLEKLRGKHAKNPALVFMTGYADIRPEEAYNRGASAMIGKPFNRDELVSTVRHAVLPLGERWASSYTATERHINLNARFDSFAQAAAAHRFNIGQGGLFLAVDDRLPPLDEPVAFKFEFPNDNFKVIEGDGLVRWVRRQAGPDTPKGVGIEIKSMIGQNRELVLALVRGLESPAYIPLA